MGCNVFWCNSIINSYIKPEKVPKHLGLVQQMQNVSCTKNRNDLFIKINIDIDFYTIS